MDLYVYNFNQFQIYTNIYSTPFLHLKIKILIFLNMEK